MKTIQIGLVSVLVVTVVGTLHGQVYFHDTFDDRDAMDGDPVTWLPNPLIPGGSRSADSGDYVMTASPNVTMGSVASKYPFDDDVSIRTMLNLSGAFDFAGMSSRTGPESSYWAAIDPQGRIGIWVTTSFQGVVNTWMIQDTATGLDVIGNNVNLQFDNDGEYLGLTAWLENTPQPSAPQLWVRDRSLTRGPVGMFLNAANSEVSATFPFFEVASFAGPDCNGDGLLTRRDLACVATIQQRDVILELLRTLPGDLDGDRKVGFADFLVLSANFNLDLPSYVDGNIDLNDGVDFEDFVILSNNFGKRPGSVAAPTGDLAAVPEPQSAMLMAFAGLALLRMRRHVRHAR